MVHVTVRAQPDGEILEKIRARDRAPSSKPQAYNNSGDQAAS